MLKAVIAGFGLIIAITPAQAQTLYDGAKNTSFSTQGWIVPPRGTQTGTQTVSNGGTTLNTTASDSIQDGFSIFTPPGQIQRYTLNRIQGYTLGFNAQLLSEAHGSNYHRAGFSIIALSSDLRGIELGFWTNDSKSNDRIWAQNDGDTKPPRFTHAEGTSFNPSRSLTRYDLSVKGDRYDLFANGNFQARILTGSLRNYSLEKTPYNIYTTPNFIFFGDNTTSARASVRITRVDLSNTAIPLAGSTSRARLAATAVPEPMTMLGTGVAVAVAGLIQHKRKQ